MKFYIDIINASKHKHQLLADIALHLASIKEGPDSAAGIEWESRGPHSYNETESHLLFDILPDYAEVFESLPYLLGAWAELEIDFDIGEEYPDFAFNWDTWRVQHIDELQWHDVTRGFRSAKQE
jgi:hypothetical protein